MHSKRIVSPALALAAAALIAATAGDGVASSHREAPFITEQPKVDATDFYMFRSYEEGRGDFVTIVANYLPLQDPYGGPNYFSLDPEALYEVHIDNNGDAVEDLTFSFRTRMTVNDITLVIGPEGNQKTVSVPLINVGPISPEDGANAPTANTAETYTLDVVRGDRRSGERTVATNGAGETRFTKPLDYIGEKSFPDYAAYAQQFIHAVDFGGGMMGRVFVGQRKDPFVVNLGETFDLVNLDPLGPEDGNQDDLADKNVTSFVLEVPITFLTNGGSPVIGGWTTASLRQGRALNPQPAATGSGGKGPAFEGGPWVQVSRLASPLVNEVVIGLKDKDRFNASEPKDDGQFLDYVTHPTLPALLEVLFGVPAPSQFPREDLIQVFLTGVPELNQPAAVVGAEMLRLNTAIDAVPASLQKRLGVIDGDLAGYPNGRRPGDDVVDISLRAVMGVLLPEDVAPVGQAALTDGAIVDYTFFDNAFPYLRTPLAGSPQE